MSVGTRCWRWDERASLNSFNMQTSLTDIEFHSALRGLDVHAPSHARAPGSVAHRRVVPTLGLLYSNLAASTTASINSPPPRLQKHGQPLRQTVVFRLQQHRPSPRLCSKPAALDRAHSARRCSQTKDLWRGKDTRRVWRGIIGGGGNGSRCARGGSPGSRGKPPPPPPRALAGRLLIATYPPHQARAARQNSGKIGAQLEEQKRKTQNQHLAELGKSKGQPEQLVWD